MCVPQRGTKIKEIVMSHSVFLQRINCTLYQIQKSILDTHNCSTKNKDLILRNICFQKRFLLFTAGNIYIGCGVAQTRVSRGSVRVRRGLVRVRRGSDSSASACCMACPSSNLGSAPRGGLLPSGSNEEFKSGSRRVLYIKYCMYAR